MHLFSSDNITRKLIMVVFSIYFIVTLSVTLLHMGAQYLTAVKQVADDLHDFTPVFQGSLSQALWAYNDHQVRTLLLGALNSRLIVGVDMQSSISGSIFFKRAAKGYILDKAQTVQWASDWIGEEGVGVPAHYTRLIAHAFPLGIVGPRGEFISIGQVKIYSSYGVVFDNIKTSFFVLLMNALFKTLVLYGLFLWIGYYYLNQPLQALTLSIQGVAAEGTSHATQIVLNARRFIGTEIEAFTGAFNWMIQKLDQLHTHLLNTQDRLSGIINAMPSILVCVTEAGILKEWNQLASDVGSLTDPPQPDKNIITVFPTMAQYMPLVQAAIHTNSVQKKQKVLAETDGGQHYYDVTIYPIFYDLGKECVINLEDITLRVRIEKAMAHTEKMTSLGGLAAGVAHEINSPLGGISQGVQTILRRLDDRLEVNLQAAESFGISLPVLNDYLKQRNILNFLNGMRESAERATRIIKNLLQFSRKAWVVPTQANLADSVEKAVSLMKTAYNIQGQIDFKTIKIQHDYPPTFPLVPCVVTEIEQVILNILKNAAHSFYGWSGSPVITLGIRATQTMVQLSIKDTGQGMTDEVRKRVFEPFFTTSTHPDNLGLGLFVAHEIIVGKHGGSLHVESQPGEGATFIIALPIAERLAKRTHD